MKYIKYIKYIFIFVSVCFVIYFAAAYVEPSKEKTLAELFSMSEVELDQLTAEQRGNTSPVAFNLNWAYVLTGLAVLFSIILPFIDMLQNPKKLKKFGINVGLILAVLLISFLIASPDMPTGAITSTTPETTKQLFDGAPWKSTDTGLIMMYILAFAAFAAIVVGGVVNAVRNR